MKIDRLITLLPCSNLEDLRLDRNPDESEELLSAWSALWHPALIDAAQAMPGWHPADQPPQESAGSLIILPECCESLLPDGWLAECRGFRSCAVAQIQTPAGNGPSRLGTHWLAVTRQSIRIWPPISWPWVFAVSLSKC